MTYARPRPLLDDDNRHFWTGGQNGQLNIIKCGDCGEFTHPPRIICRHCRSENVAPESVSGEGVVDTFTINYQPWAEDMEVPFIIARVRLKGVPGVYLTTNIVGCSVDDIKIDDLVCVMFEEQDGIWFPLFKKAD